MKITLLSEKAKEIISRDGYHVPILFVEGTKQTGVSLLDLSMTGDARHLYMRTLGQQFAREDRHGELKQLSMVSEAWMSLPKGGKLPAYRPSQDPDRTEVLIITQLTVATRACQMAIYRMVRDQAGTLATLETIGLPGAVTAESPLLEAFLEGYAQATTPHPLGQTVSLLSTAGRRWAPTRPALRRVR